MYILGISCYFHDSAAALLHDGILVAAAEEERFSRKKHDSGFPRRAIRFCLETAGIQAADLDFVVFYEKPYLKFERILLSSMATFPRSQGMFREAMVNWFADKLWIHHAIQKETGMPAAHILYSEHHLSHASSAFLCSPFEEAAILTVDGVGEWATAAIGVGRANEVRLLREIRFPHSLGLLYSAFTAFLGFEVNEGEYKVMGMAAFGRPRYVEQVRRCVSFGSDGSFELNLDYFCFHYSTGRMFSNEFVRLFGEPRRPESGFDPASEEGRRYADIAASIQAVTEEMLVAMANYVQCETGLRRLCIAGGVGLNSAANWKIRCQTAFDQIYVQPSAGDGGGALGAALYAWHTVLGKPRGFVMEHAYWGREHSSGEVHDFLTDVGSPHLCFDSEETLVARVTDELAAGKVVGWFQGRFEWGPRALGNRSILADPRQEGMKERVNSKIKYRELFRPFAPSVPMEAANCFFDLGPAVSEYPAQFMLYVSEVKAAQRHKLPAVTHVDGTARVQAVNGTHNPRFHRLIQSFGEATGVPVLMNTSFNLRGEPIVNTPREAFQTFQRSGMDLLVLGDCLIGKGNADARD